MLRYKGVKIRRAKLGGDWADAAKCGSRASNWNNSPLNLNANNSGRGSADTVLVLPYSPLADLYTVLEDSKIQNDCDILASKKILKVRISI